MATQYPADRRAPWGASLRADALFRLEKYEEAGAAFEAALASAQRAGNDSLASSAAESIPVCYFRHAESAVAADSTDYERHAELFEKVAANWPEYEHAHLSQYRAGLAYLNARRHEDGVRVMQDLITRFPEGEYVKDAHLHIAKTWEATEDHERAAVAYVNFSERYPDDDSADDAWLKAADLYATAGLEQQNDQLRLGYIERFPDDRETAMEILEEFARRDIEGVTPEQPVSLLLGKKKPRSHLAEYLERAKKDPELASAALIAEVKFLEAEEARAAYDALELTLPLKKSIAKKQKSLDKLMDRYQECVEIGISEWARASAFRIGQSLVGFGAALETSQRPRDLKGDDLLAYEDVLLDESQVFYDRGEAGIAVDASGQAVLLSPRVRVPARRRQRSAAEAGSALTDRLSRRSESRDGKRNHGRRQRQRGWTMIRALVLATVLLLTGVMGGFQIVAAEDSEEAATPAPSEAAPLTELEQAELQATLSPEEPYWLFHAGELLVAEDDPAMAETSLLASLERDSSYAPALSLLSKLYFDTGRHAEALALLEPLRARAAGGSYGAPQALLEGLALHYDALDEVERAAAVMAELAALQGEETGSPRVYLTLRGEAPDAATDLAVVELKKPGKSAVNHNNYGITKLRAGEPETAREAFLTAIEIDPSLPGPYYNLAILEKFYRFNDEAAVKWFGLYQERSRDDPDGLIDVFAESAP
jgi:tetratricopeptide (TPR) repeat protein